MTKKEQIPKTKMTLPQGNNLIITILIGQWWRRCHQKQWTTIDGCGGKTIFGLLLFLLLFL